MSYKFSKYAGKNKTPFEQLFNLFKQLLTYTSGDVPEALDWLNELDKEYSITNENYTMQDFINDLKEKGYLKDDENNNGEYLITPKTEQAIRQSSFDLIFGKLLKNKNGNHRTTHNTNSGDEMSDGIRPFEFGDNTQNIAMLESIKNAQHRGIDGTLQLHENDLLVHEKEYKSQTATVLMIDISHSMILYGEDRITPAKMVAMALAEMIHTKYPKDFLDIIVFGDDAWQITVKDLPYLQVGPYHTNTVAGLELASSILRKRKSANKKIFMITDGKPSCLIENGTYYKNSNGLDRRIVNKCVNLAAACKKNKIEITTFMVANDNYLQQFIDEFTEANQGKAYYTGLQGLGDMIFKDYQKNKKRKL